MALQFWLFDTLGVVFWTEVAKITEEVLQGTGTDGRLLGHNIVPTILTDGRLAQPEVLFLIA